MRNQPKIGLTGGIASGKSLVASLFRECGCRIIDADQIAHDLIRSDQKGYKPLIEAFGPDICTTDGEIDRPRLGAIIFHDQAKRHLINSILHPLIRAEMRRLFRLYAKQDPSNPIIHDIPLLIETGLYKTMDIIILVYLDRQVQLERLVRRDGLSTEAATQLLEIQMPLDHKRPFATHIIDNNGSVEHTRSQVQTLYTFLLQSRNG
ncbi:dephospho-CoA kinase [bacterium]|nr:dephospho-CoA kinase [bacterium]